MKAKLIEKFVSIYGEGGEIRSFFSPGRVNLIGEHTDKIQTTSFPIHRAKCRDGCKLLQMRWKRMPFL